MPTQKRRDEILRFLSMDMKPVSASTLAEHFNVSRQVIVGDIALLRASGTDILATPRGYILNKNGDDDSDAIDSYVVACHHDKGGLERELYTIVDNGGSLVNVIVEHPVYGTIKQELNINSRYDADKFLAKMATTGASLICSLDNGIHLHTIRCPDPDSYRRILTGLRDLGILYIKQ